MLNLDVTGRPGQQWSGPVGMARRRLSVQKRQNPRGRFGKPEIFNTDQGSQFTSVDFTKALLAEGIKISMDGKGTWRDNVFVERIWKSVKYDLRAYESVGHARASIGR